ncbi:TIGR03749 family integrating conjugative element protein [Pseudomonas graminis]|uniref:TIGR03749 family integrating conjugative element protein n=1 Tax=Pseudomonas graminis TaxID=158627 RepID=UPI00234919F5|nr:TIGR03749 family integrating conjugative element protein [Pseudomonas graminis]MDC6381761.1 TIGR03749 family integrating conjugative element protein [Pseudomonas graminis]
MRSFICGLVVAACLTGNANAVEIQQWERIPIALPLAVGQERIVFVDQNVRVGLPRALKGKLRIQSTGGAIYLLANEPIPPTRVQLQNVASGEIMLVDIAAIVSAPDQAALEPMKIVARHQPGSSSARSHVAKNTGANSQDEKAEEQTLSTDIPAPKTETPTPVVITRYAAQLLYAPLRTVEPVPGVSQVNLNRRLDLTTLLPTQPINASALGAWRMAGYWVTAVKLQNASEQHLTLDPRELMGDFTAATFQHPYLGAKGHATDTTIVYLVTQGHGLAESLVPANIARIDPKGGSREE